MSMFRTLQSQARIITFFLSEPQAVKVTPELRRLANSGKNDTVVDDNVKINVSTSFPTRDQLKYIMSIATGSSGTTSSSNTYNVLHQCIDADRLSQILKEKGEETLTSTEVFGVPLSQVSSEIWKCGTTSNGTSSNTATGLWVDWEKGIVGNSLDSLKKYLYK